MKFGLLADLNNLVNAPDYKPKETETIETQPEQTLGLVSEINESSDEAIQHQLMLEELINLLFDRSKVITTTEQLTEAGLAYAGDPMGGERASAARAQERSWVQDMVRAQREKEGAQHRSGLGLERQAAAPAKGQFVMLPSESGKMAAGRIVKSDGENCTIQHPSGRSMFVPCDRLVPGRSVRGEPTWMLKQ